MPHSNANVSERLLNRMRDLDARWSDRDTANVWDETTRIAVEPSPKRPEYLIAVTGELAQALRAAAARAGVPPDHHARWVLSEALASSI